MIWTLPGTTLTVDREDSRFIEQQFSSMFFGGGIVLSQVAAVTGLEPYTVQNWVKREFLPPPDHKRYNMNQLCRVITINMLKKVLPMEEMKRVAHCVALTARDFDGTRKEVLDTVADICEKFPLYK